MFNKYLWARWPYYRLGSWRVVVEKLGGLLCWGLLVVSELQRLELRSHLQVCS